MKSMNEQTLTKVALSCSVIGLTVLFIVSSHIKEELYYELENAKLGSKVTVSGIVERVIEKEKVVVVELTDVNDKKNRNKSPAPVISVVLFRNPKKALNISEGDVIKVKGTVEEYKGERELIGEEVLK